MGIHGRERRVRLHSRYNCANANVQSFTVYRPTSPSYCKGGCGIIMINVEPWVYTQIYNAVTAKYPDISIAGEYVPSPATFPHVSVVCVYNVPYRRASTLEEVENCAETVFTVDVYSNSTDGKKSQCWAIMSVVDDAMKAMNFSRADCSPRTVPNLETDIYRLNARYRAIISNKNEIFRG
nr:MAG TPA: hypothetical protein [Bacteriophage sp.]